MLAQHGSGSSGSIFGSLAISPVPESIQLFHSWKVDFMAIAKQLKCWTHLNGSAQLMLPKSPTEPTAGVKAGSPAMVTYQTLLGDHLSTVKAKRKEFEDGKTNAWIIMTKIVPAGHFLRSIIDNNAEAEDYSKAWKQVKDNFKKFNERSEDIEIRKSLSLIKFETKQNQNPVIGAKEVKAKLDSLFARRLALDPPRITDTEEKLGYLQAALSTCPKNIECSIEARENAEYEEYFSKYEEILGMFFPKTEEISRSATQAKIGHVEDVKIALQAAFPEASSKQISAFIKPFKRKFRSKDSDKSSRGKGDGFRQGNNGRGYEAPGSGRGGGRSKWPRFDNSRGGRGGRGGRDGRGRGGRGGRDGRGDQGRNSVYSGCYQCGSKDHFASECNAKPSAGNAHAAAAVQPIEDKDYADFKKFQEFRKFQESQVQQPTMQQSLGGFAVPGFGALQYRPPPPTTPNPFSPMVLPGTHRAFMMKVNLTKSLQNRATASAPDTTFPTFLIDSGCSAVVLNKDFVQLDTRQAVHVPLEIASGALIYTDFVANLGSLKVLVASKFSRNLLGVGALEDLGFSVVFRRPKAYLESTKTEERFVFGAYNEIDQLYYTIDEFWKLPLFNASFSAFHATMNSCAIQHNRFGHWHDAALCDAMRKGLIGGLDIPESIVKFKEKRGFCEACALSKATDLFSSYSW